MPTTDPEAVTDDAMDLNDEGVRLAALTMYRNWCGDARADWANEAQAGAWVDNASATIAAYLRAVPESDERQAWRVLRCPKCGSRNTECQARPHVHRCLDCGYDGTAAALSPDEGAGGE